MPHRTKANPFAQSPQYWKVLFTLPASAVGTAEEAFNDIALAVSGFEYGGIAPPSFGASNCNQVSSEARQSLCFGHQCVLTHDSPPLIRRQMLGTITTSEADSASARRGRRR